MLEHLNFLEPNRSLDTAMAAYYVPSIVALSIFVSIFASYTAFLVSAHLQSVKSPINRKYWGLSAAYALGSGVWAMHFIGMLAYKLPIEISYDVLFTFISGIPAILASVVILQTKPEHKITGLELLIQSVILGGCIGAMHYVGMFAIRLDGIIRYEPVMFSSSIIVAVLLSGLSLWVKSWSHKNEHIRQFLSPKLIFPSLIMGCAISGMHYTGMSSMYVFPSVSNVSSNFSVDSNAWTPQALAIAISMISLSVSSILIFSIKISSQLGAYKLAGEVEIQRRVITQRALDAQKFAMDQHSLVAITDITGTITYANEKFCKVSGYTKQELIGQNHRLLNSDNQPKSYWKAMFKSVAQGNVWNDEVRNKSKNGSYYWVDTTIIPLMDNKGMPESYISIRTDITKNKKIEASLEEHLHSLEKTIFERTKEAIYAQNKAERAQQQAEEASKEKSRFLANMSHELRTPMHAITSFTNLSLKRVDDAKVKKFLENIKTSSTRLTELLNNLLDLSKLEANKMIPEFANHNLISLTHHCIKEMHSLCEDKGQTIEVNTPSPTEVEGIFDKKLMAQVIINLLSNAIKFSPVDSTIKIDIETCQYCLDDLEQSAIKLTVTDHGIGIPKDELATVFNKFIQSSKTQTEAGGTGLGLPICQEIINIHKGKIWAESPIEGVSTGTAFHFVIPVTMNTPKKQT